MHNIAYFCSMIKEERLRLILEILSNDQKVLLSTLSEKLNVSADTIRRDIKSLSDQGLLKAVRGGAVPHSSVPRHFRAREHYDTASKQLIASKALPFLKAGQVVLFDGGTSTLALAALIPADMKITVITHSFPIANILEDHPSVELIFAGGRLNKTSFTAMGQDTIRAFRNIRADLCFLGICSIHPLLGITTKDYEEAALKKTMVDMSKQTIALSTSEKIDKADNYYICAVTEIDSVITDKLPAADSLAAYKEVGLTII